MELLLRQCGSVARRLVRPTSPCPRTPVATLLANPRRLASHKPRPKENTKPLVNCACARHPVPEEKSPPAKVATKSCDFDFRKLEVNPYDQPCDCQDPPPAAGCKDVGRPKEVCCRSTRQYGCFCEEEEEEEESCEEEEEAVQEVKTCDLDFRKLEVNPYDDPCDCQDPPPASSCESLANRADVCCRTQRPFGCDCTEKPGLDCLKEKGPKQKAAKKECDNKKWKGKCL